MIVEYSQSHKSKHKFLGTTGAPVEICKIFKISHTHRIYKKFESSGHKSSDREKSSSANTSGRSKNTRTHKIFVFKKSSTSSSKTKHQNRRGSPADTNDQKEPQGGWPGRRRGLYRERHFSRNRPQVGRRGKPLLGKAPEGGREVMLQGGSGGDHPQ
ncbi:hypothetical protein NPIL_616651 [Nephila pilipes]|uniref:Uncharacterized protein n=1 Tax=Nephila pilipes TaxID=299642 RepID=A0A8X6P7N6_NEPPI|nr:hypothetical protein NPIL_616651 [Nephila pilipes]